jgi:putative molybdopterin biosynthesis protein
VKRRVFLRMKPLSEARELFLNRFQDPDFLGAEEVPTPDSLFRVTAAAVHARLSSPAFHSAAMDGVAVWAETTHGVTERNPRLLTIGRDAHWVNTGHLMPAGTNAVIMVEKLHQADEETLEITSPVHPWQNVRKVGEDIVATELLLPQNHVITPFDLGALIGGGVFQVKVKKRPHVAIVPTGSELVDHRGISGPEDIPEGRILEYNSIILSGLVRESGGVPFIYPIVEDRYEAIRDTVLRAVQSEAHLVIVNAGSSAGSEDYTYHVLEELGEVFVHGVAMMPGKPTILGAIKNKPVVGNPGYPVSSVLSFDQFVRPLLYKFLGLPEPRRKTVTVSPSRAIPSKMGTEEFVRVNLGKVRDTIIATPLPRAAGSITTLTRAEGLIRIPSSSEGIDQNEKVEAELFVEPEELSKTVVLIGSHDITVDILADEMRRTGRGFRISSSNVGSLGGLMALRRGSAHAAGSHLLDTETGDYNTTYIRRYLKGVPVALFQLVWREQGLILQKGNPLNIKGVEDLQRKEVIFVNRQAGSGTRILLDYKLAQLGMDPSSVQGYDHEEFTHMAVAVDVKSGAAHAGLGIYAAARALDLDFIPVARERYDLVIPVEFLELENIQQLLEIARSERYRSRVSALGGYDPSESGTHLGTY